jgi:hypothetical protein
MRWPSHPLAVATAVLVSILAATDPSWASDRDTPATIEAGRRLLAENGCNGACHRSRAEDDDPRTLYTRATRKVHSRDELVKQVETCVSRLGSMIFPEEIGSVAAALDHDHYRFD